jgi:hypothetical protein
MPWRSMLVVLIACGCTGSDGSITPFIGIYATTSHTLAQPQGGTVSCTDPGTPVASAAPFLHLAIDNSYLDPFFLRFSECPDATATMCVQTSVVLEAGGPGLLAENAYTQTSSDVMCQLHFIHSEAALNGAAISISVLGKYDAPNISFSDCTLERAQALASSPECVSVERWTGTRRP